MTEFLVGLSFQLTRIFEDDEEDEEDDVREQNEDMETDSVKIEDLMNNIVPLDDGEHKSFRLVQKNESQLYTFDKKEVQKLYSVLLSHVIGLTNSIPQSLQDQRLLKAYRVQLVSSHQFINSVFKESTLIYKGKSQYKDQAGFLQQRSTIEFKGVIFGALLQRVADRMKRVPAKKESEETPGKSKLKEVARRMEIKTVVEPQSEYFSFRKTLKQVQFEWPSKPAKFLVKH